MINYLRFSLIVAMLSGVLLLGVEVFFLVTNSDRPEFWPEDTDAPQQEMSSGLFSGYVHEDNPDHEKMKAKYGDRNFTVDMIGGLECGKCHY